MCGCFGNMYTCIYCVLYCFVYVHLFLCVLFVLVQGQLPPCDNSIAVVVVVVVVVITFDIVRVMASPDNYTSTTSVQVIS